MQSTWVFSWGRWEALQKSKPESEPPIDCKTVSQIYKPEDKSILVYKGTKPVEPSGISRYHSRDFTNTMFHPSATAQTERLAEDGPNNLSTKCMRCDNGEKASPTDSSADEESISHGHCRN